MRNRNNADKLWPTTQDSKIHQCVPWTQTEDDRKKKNDEGKMMLCAGLRLAVKTLKNGRHLYSIFDHQRLGHCVNHKYVSAWTSRYGVHFTPKYIISKFSFVKQREAQMARIQYLGCWGNFIKFLLQIVTWQTWAGGVTSVRIIPGISALIQ